MQHNSMSEISLPTVLVVDDNRIYWTVLAELMRAECRLIVARDGAAALRRIKEEDVSVVILDDTVPAIDAYELLQCIKLDVRTSDTAIILITSRMDETHTHRLGVTDQISKPVRPSIVRAHICAHLELTKYRRKLVRPSTEDALTGITHRRHFDEIFEQRCQQWARRRDRIAVAMFDVDHFRQYNCLYGHSAGDDALRQIAQVMSRCARKPEDVVARYGGEEFVLFVHQPNNIDAMLQKLQCEIMALGIPHARSGTDKRITISGGALIASLAEPADPTMLLGLAQRLLYRAKREGRNRIVTGKVSLTLPSMMHGAEPLPLGLAP